jgi:hypothetical protein
MQLRIGLSAFVLAAGVAAAAPAFAEGKPSSVGLGIFTFTSGQRPSAYPARTRRT